MLRCCWCVWGGRLARGSGTGDGVLPFGSWTVRQAITTGGWLGPVNRTDRCGVYSHERRSPPPSQPEFLNYRAVFASLFFVGSAHAQAAVSPLVLEEVPGSFRLYNSGAAPLRLQVEVLDFEQDGDGSNRYMERGSSVHSCGDRISVGDAPTFLSAHSTVRIPVEIAPGDLCWASVRFGFAAGAAPFRHFVATKVYFIPPGLSREAAIVSLAQESRGGQPGLVLSLRSSGGAPLRPEGRVEFRAVGGSDSTPPLSVELGDFGVHPSTDRHLWFPQPADLPSGQYVVLVILDIGRPDPVAAQSLLEF